MAFYYLMHKNDICAMLSLKDGSGDFDSICITKPDLMPYLGKADERKMNLWWKMRAVPASRSQMLSIIRREGLHTPSEYLEKNLALSMTDVYWICPVDASLTWEEVNLRNMLRHGIREVAYHSASTYDPNAALSGQLEKYWDLSGKTPILVKECSAYHGLQAINELFADRVSTLQETKIPFVHYELSTDHDEYRVFCDAFTDENTEFVSAYEIVNSQKLRNDQSLYDAFIKICSQNGLEEEPVRNYMDYQTSLDFVISNTDRHLLNFGVLRDTETLQFVGVAPIFDNGNSMFYDEYEVYTKSTMLERRITAFHDREEKMLAHIKNRGMIDMPLLPDGEEVKAFYTGFGIGKERAETIAQNYTVKLELFSDFQKGKKISSYHEKTKGRKA